MWLIGRQLFFWVSSNALCRFGLIVLFGVSLILCSDCESLFLNWFDKARCEVGQLWAGEHPSKDDLNRSEF